MKTYHLNTTEQNVRSARNLTAWIYFIQATGLILILPLFIGAVINHAKINNIRDTLAKSHFRWQIRTFWFLLLWIIVGLSTIISYQIILFFIGFYWAGLTHIFQLCLLIGSSWLWAAYRVTCGWMVLSNKQQAY